jgi:hypothetical protein
MRERRDFTTGARPETSGQGRRGWVQIRGRRGSDTTMSGPVAAGVDAGEGEEGRAILRSTAKVKVNSQVW